MLTTLFLAKLKQTTLLAEISGVYYKIKILHFLWIKFEKKVCPYYVKQISLNLLTIQF